MKLSERLMPAAVLQRYTSTQAKRLSYLALLDVMLTLFFILAVAVKLATSDSHLFGGLVLAISIAFPLSLWFARRGFAAAASLLTLVAFFANVNVAGFFLPFAHYLELYRTMAFGVTLLVVACLVSFTRLHVIISGLMLFAAFNTQYFLRVRPRWEGPSGDMLSTMVVGNVLILAIASIAVVLYGFTDEIIALAEAASKKSAADAERLKRTLAEARHSLSVGLRLDELAAGSLAALERADACLEDAATASERMDAAADESRAISVDLLESSRKALDHASEERRQAEDTVAEIGEIARRVGAASQSARERHAATAALQESLVRAEAAFSQSGKKIDAVGASSAELRRAIAEILDIGERIGILSMNASIEAARAGAAGAGFKVLATEIRALSDETGRRVLGLERTLGELVEDVDAAEANYAQVRGALDDVSSGLSEARSAFSDIAAGAASAEQGIGTLKSGASRLLSSSEAASASAASTESRGQDEARVADRLLASARELSGALSVLRDAFSSLKASATETARIGAENKESIGSISSALES